LTVVNKLNRKEGHCPSSLPDRVAKVEERRKLGTLTCILDVRLVLIMRKKAESISPHKLKKPLKECSILPTPN
jgi:hypothetical protein